MWDDEAGFFSCSPTLPEPELSATTMVARLKWPFFMMDVGSLIRCDGWWDGVVQYGLSRAHEEWRRITTQREMRYGVLLVCPLLIRSSQSIFLRYRILPAGWGEEIHTLNSCLERFALGVSPEFSAI